jgi:CysZ protein
MSLFRSLLFGFVNLMHPRMLWLMVWPVLIALVLWGSVALAFWVRAALWLAGVLSHWLDASRFLASVNIGDVTLVAANVLLFLLFVPLVYMTALFIVGIFGMQAMVDYVARRSYPGLERRRGGGALGSGWNGVVALLGMLILALVTLPLWLVPPLWPLIPIGILGWGNQRLLRYDAVAEHADREEMRRLFAERRGALYLLGALLALVAYIPIIGLLTPVWFGLAFIHYLLGALEIERRYARHDDNELAQLPRAP